MKSSNPRTLLAFTATLLLLVPAGFAQTTIWSDNFNNGCASNCLASTWNGWTVQDNVGGTTGGAPNNWFVSCAEEGITPPGCGSSCVGDQSLHVGANPGAGGDMGASFNETGATNATYRMAVSPNISTSGHTGTITLTFDFIAYGSAACSDDRAQLRLSSDGGATWPAGLQYCLTSACCGACNGYSQGQWTTYTLALPAAFSNNPNVRVGFHWRNNGNGSGTDPSAAIDDIRLTTPVALSVNLVDFFAERNSNSGTTLKWIVNKEILFSHYELERSLNGADFQKIHTQEGSCDAGAPKCTYTFNDKALNGTVYYRLKMVDQDGTYTYSTILSMDANDPTSGSFTLISNIVKDNALQLTVSARKKSEADIVITSAAGRQVLSEKGMDIKNGTNQKSIDISKLALGVYIVKITLDDGAEALMGTFVKYM